MPWLQSKSLCKRAWFSKKKNRLPGSSDPVYQHGITQNGKHCDPGSKTEQHSGCKDPQQQCKCTALSTGRTLRGNVKRRFLMLERYLIEHCSPTLASVKTANLFTWSLHRRKCQSSRYGTGIRNYRRGDFTCCPESTESEGTDVCMSQTETAGAAR